MKLLLINIYDKTTVLQTTIFDIDSFKRCFQELKTVWSSFLLLYVYET